VHRANMSKLDDNGRPIMVDRKVSKGPNYQPPDIRAVLDG
jgi:predicted HAD superfamily Cof-like phosphohydrolase